MLDCVDALPVNSNFFRAESRLMHAYRIADIAACPATRFCLLSVAADETKEIPDVGDAAVKSAEQDPVGRRVDRVRICLEVIDVVNSCEKVATANRLSQIGRAHV